MEAFAYCLLAFMFPGKFIYPAAEEFLHWH